MSKLHTLNSTKRINKNQSSPLEVSFKLSNASGLGIILKDKFEADKSGMIETLSLFLPYLLAAKDTYGLTCISNIKPLIDIIRDEDLDYIYPDDTTKDNIKFLSFLAKQKIYCYTENQIKNKTYLPPINPNSHFLEAELEPYTLAQLKEKQAKYQIKKNFAEGMNYYVKAILSPTDNEAFLIKAINNLKAFIDRQIANLAPSKKEIIDGLSTLTKISTFYRTSDSKDLDNYIIDKMQTFLNWENNEIIRILDQFHDASYAAHDYDLASEHAQHSYDLYKKDTSKFSTENSFRIICNLAGYLSTDDNYEDIIKLYEEASVIMPNNQQLILIKYNIHKEVGENYKALLEVDKIKDSDLKMLLGFSTLLTEPQYYHNFKSNLGEWAKGCKYRPLSLDSNIKFINYKIICAQVAAHENNYEEAAAHYCDIIEETDLLEEKYDHIIFAITHMRNNLGEVDYAASLKFYNKIYEKFPALKEQPSEIIKYYEFILYNKNNLDKEALQSLYELEILNQNDEEYEDDYYIENAGEIYISTLIDKKKYQEAIAYINNDFVSTPQNIEEYLNYVTNLQNQRQRQEEHKNEAIAPANCSYLPTDQSSKEELESIDPKCNHVNFKNSKKQLYLKTKLAQNIQNKFSWVINLEEVYTKNSPMLKSVENKPHFHAVIHSSIIKSKKLSSNTLEKFENSLNKIAGRTLGQNGIKFIDNKLIELKIKGNERLYADKKYINSDGEYLIIFDKITNHDGIKRIAHDAPPLLTISADPKINQDIESEDVIDIHLPFYIKEDLSKSELGTNKENIAPDLSIIGEQQDLICHNQDHH